MKTRIFKFSLLLFFWAIAINLHAKEVSTEEIPEAIGTITSHKQARSKNKSVVFDSMKKSRAVEVAQELIVDPSIDDLLESTDVQEVAAQCNDNAFITTGASLLNEIRNQGYACVERLFGAASDAVRQGTFTEANIMTVANEAKNEGVSYDGVDATKYFQSLHYWIRAFYYYGNREYLTAANQIATKEAIDTLVANSHFFDKTVENAEVINLVLGGSINNALIGEYYVSLVRNLLNTFDQSYNDVPKWGSAFASIFWDVLGQCANKSECQVAEHNTALVSQIGNYFHDNLSWIDNKNSDYHLHNFGYQLALFYAGRTENHFEALRPELETQLNRIFNNFGPDRGDIARRAYLLALAGVNAHDQCQVYNVCSKKQEIIDLVLNDRINCPSGTLFLWAQDMNQAQKEWACSSLGQYETYFHDTFQTSNVPVTPDDNDTLRMVVFNDSREWNIYGFTLFGAGTNNGGLYLEGDPSQAGDQATFFAYEHVSERPIFDIWNLRHEYIHYLDGRFIKKGDFEEVNDAGRTKWYTEGVAEYMSLKDCNAAAITEARNNTHALSTIFQNGDGTGQDRVYRWGYLANRFMFTTHPAEYVSMQSLFKQGDYTTYRSTMVDLWVANQTFDAEFSTWLQTVESTGCVIDTTRPPSPIEPINVDDVQGTDQVGINACANGDQPSTTILAGEAICLPDTVAGQQLQMQVDVPAGLVNVTLQITLRHGNGNPTLLHRYGARPSDTIYDHISNSAGVEETILETPVQQNWNYIHVPAEANYSGVTLLARYIQNPIVPSISSPSSGSTLTGSSQTFSWSGNGANATQWWIYAGSSVGASNYLDSGTLGSATNTTITGLPTNGSTVHVRLWYKDGTWKHVDSSYTAATLAATLPEISAPTIGSTLTGSSQTFSWMANSTSVSEWWVYVGSNLGASNYHDSSTLGSATNTNITGLPTDGSTVYVRLWYKEGSWKFTDSSYTAATLATTLPEISAPAVGSTLTGASQTFSWQANSTSVSEWWLYIGSSVGVGDYIDSGTLGLATSTTITTLPVDGSTVYVRLWYKQGSWKSVDYTYTAASSVGELVPLSPSGTITTDQPTFTWTAKSSITNGETYAVQAYDGEEVQQVWNAVTADQAGCGSGTGTCSYMLSTAFFAEGDGYWKVQDNEGNFSETMNFTVSTVN